MRKFNYFSLSRKKLYCSVSVSSKRNKNILIKLTLIKVSIYQLLLILIYISPMLHLCTPQKREKTEGFLTFLGGAEM